VEQSIQLTYDEVRALPSVRQRSRMVCVEGWSAPAVWEGFRFSEVLKKVKPQPGADFVTVYAFGGYQDTLSVADLSSDRVLFAWGMDGADLPVQHGYPLRLIVPPQYGYKGPKGIVTLEFAPQMAIGYWEAYGYSAEGTVQPGFDQPLDLGGTRKIKGGEITEY
jgi:DMSO/TMAO reductase YedYZ molybdopterin-dependent catalytic subunit